jgi:signal transduction histidine kinase
MSVRSKLVLLSAAPVLVTGTLLLALFLWGHGGSSAAYEHARAWEEHAESLRTLDWAVRFYVDSVADGIVEDPMPHHAESKAKLAQARTEVLSLSRRFSIEEQAALQRLDAHLAELIVEGERVGKDRTRLNALTKNYSATVAGAIRERVLEETNGAARTVRAAQDLSNAVRMGGFAVALVALLSAVGASMVAIRRFGGRVASLQAAASRVAAGDLEQNVRVTSGDELGRLGGSLNLMIEALRRQRTRQLGFLAAVAHDLRNPLGAMRISTQALLQRTDASSEPQLRKSLALIERQIERLSRMADDLLDAASIEAGELKLERRSCDLAAVMRDVTELYAGTSPRHELRISVPHEPVTLMCDPTRIAQVLENLVSNAIKYSPAGGTVDVTLAPTAEEVVVSVADTGVGIEPGMFDAIFEPFRRLTSTKDVLPGVGLGLSICRRIVAAHGGQIDVASERGRGAKFEVHLPRQPPPAR